MNENAGQFRTAAFGGFNRQDVLDYIEKLTQENQEKSLELERALEREETVRTQSEARFAEAEEQAEKTRLANDLQKQVRELEPEAKSWKRLKDTAGDIEVSAHERAQVTIQNAQSHAAEIRADSARWVLEIQARCDKLRADMRSAITSVETELDSVRDAFGRAQSDMDHIQDALSDLVASAGENQDTID